MINKSNKSTPFSNISYENIQDYLRWVIPGFVNLFLLFDILPDSFKEAETFISLGIILSIFIYAITHFFLIQKLKIIFVMDLGISVLE